MTTRPPIVIARPEALAERLRAAGMSLREVEAATGSTVSRSTVANVATKRDYGIRLPKAEAIAKALGVPVGALFVHRNGQPLA